MTSSESTASAAASSASIATVTSAAIAAEGSAAARAPAATSASMGAGERFQTRTSWPVSTSRPAIAEPMDPNPMKPTVVTPPPRPANRVELRLRVAGQVQRAVDRVVAAPGDQQLLGGELRDHLASVGGHDDLLLDARRTPAVCGGPIGLEREHHALLELLGVLERDQAREDRLLPDGQPDTMTVLEGECGLLVGEAELLRGRPDLDDVGRGRARAHERDGTVHVLAARV